MSEEGALVGGSSVVRVSGCRFLSRMIFFHSTKGKRKIEFANVRGQKYCNLHITVNGDIGAPFVVPA